MLVIIVTLYAIAIIAGLNAIALIYVDHQAFKVKRQALRTIQRNPYPVGQFQR